MAIARTSTIGAAQWSADTVTAVPADGTVLLVNSDPNRAAVTVSNDSTSTGDLWVVPNSGQPRGGFRVAPGAGVVIGSTAPVYGYCKNGSVTAYLLSESGVNC